MKLVLDKNNFTNTLYQLVPMYNARNVAQPTNILDIEVVDTETKVKYKLGQLLEIKDEEIKQLQKDFDEFKKDTNNRINRLLEIIEALKNETRERGVI